MEDELNKAILTKISELTPAHIKQVHHLMDLLDIGKDTAYKRLKGEVPFTFEDIVTLSKKMEFSIDEAINSSKVNRIHFNKAYPESFQGQRSFYEILNNYLINLKAWDGAETKETISALNRVHVLFAIGYSHLFRFLYYKWIHQVNGVPINTPFSEVIVPNNIAETYDKVKKYYRQMDNSTFIMDQEVYLSVIREIQYYYRRGLISLDELDLLKKDFMSYLDFIERITRKGANELGNNSLIYISNIKIQSGIIYTKYDDIERSGYWLSSINAIHTFNKKACAWNKKWLHSLKRYSILITESNEMLRTKFIDKQRGYVDTIDSESYLMKFY